MKLTEKIVSSKVIFRGDLFTISTLFVTLPDGRRVTREVAARRPSVSIVAVDQTNSVILLREFRGGIKRTVWRLPGGMVDGHRTPLNTARHELRQEAGYRATRWFKLFEKSGGGSWHWPRYFYLARGLTRQPLPPDLDERFEIKRMPLIRALRLVIKNQFESSDDGLAILEACKIIYPRRRLL